MEQSFLESNPEKELDLEPKNGRLEEILGELYKRNMYGFHEALVKKAQELKSKYPDYPDYRLYHLMIGSTVDECPQVRFSRRRFH